MRIRILLGLSALLGLNACGDTVESLAEDHELRNRILRECAGLESGSQTDERCKLAARAQVEAAKRSIKGAFE